MMSRQTHKQGDFLRRNAKSTIAAVLVLSLSFCEAVVKGDWRSDANARIEQMRERNAQITVLDSNGQPISDVNVQINQITHQFAFGSCIDHQYLPTGSSYNPAYTNFFKNNFNWAVCENESKWWYDEPTQGNVSYTDADNIYNWCNSNGITMRGHNIVWEQESGDPSWAASLGCATYPTPSALLSAVNSRINSVVNHFKGEFMHWDVDNEMCTSNFFNCLGDGGRVHMFQAAEANDPNCLLFMNEYSGNSFGSFDDTAYISRYTSLAALGAPIQAFGLQGHISSPFGDTEAQSYWTNVLKPLGAYGLPLWITEFDSDATSNSQQQATDLANFYLICFSDPNVQGIMMWGFMVGYTWRNTGGWGLVSTSGTLNAAGTQYQSLMSQWTTNTSTTTDANGNANFRGFHGTYQITLSVLGENNEINTIQLVPDPNNTTQQFTIVFNIYDLNGDGSIDWGDVGVLAENWLVPNPQKGDFNGDGIVNFLDFAEFATAWQEWGE
jgi:GH35 family endo-1,4-beta-xylanase